MPVEEQLEDAAILLGLRHRRGQGLAEVALVCPGNLVERREGIHDLRGADGDSLLAQLLEEGEQAPGGRGHRYAPAGGAASPSASLTATRSATMSMSERCLTMMLIDCWKVSRSMSSAPSSSSVRAQSIDSAIEGGFFRSTWRTMWTISTRRRASDSSSSGACSRTISISRSTSG